MGGTQSAETANAEAPEGSAQTTSAVDAATSSSSPTNKEPAAATATSSPKAAEASAAAASGSREAASSPTAAQTAATAATAPTASGTTTAAATTAATTVATAAAPAAASPTAASTAAAATTPAASTVAASTARPVTTGPSVPSVGAAPIPHSVAQPLHTTSTLHADAVPFTPAALHTPAPHLPPPPPPPPSAYIPGATSQGFSTTPYQRAPLELTAPPLMTPLSSASPIVFGQVSEVQVIPPPEAIGSYTPLPFQPAPFSNAYAPPVGMQEGFSQPMHPPQAIEAPARESKQRTLEEQMSLKPGDDERTEMSKKLSWILRHGARKVSVVIDENGWVNVQDLLGCDILTGITEDRLLAIIEESNGQKARYEIDEDPQGRKRIRAISKSRRTAAAKVERELQRRERRQNELSAEPGLLSGMPTTDFIAPWDTRRLDDAAVKDPLAAPNAAQPSSALGFRQPPGPPREGDRPRWSDYQVTPLWQDEGPTYEQQTAMGYLPVWQGDRLVAMARGEETVRPGRRTEPSKGKGSPSGDYKGQTDRKGMKGNFVGKGMDEKGFQKGYKGSEYGRKGYDVGYKGMDGDYEDKKAEGKGHSTSDASTQPRPVTTTPTTRQSRTWRAISGQDIIVRVGLGMDTDVVGVLVDGALVVQIGEDKMLATGVARMFIESLEPHPGIKGWVTRSAESAGGPVFFEPGRPRERPPAPVNNNNNHHHHMKGMNKGKQMDMKGKGRRPIGEGEPGSIYGR